MSRYSRYNRFYNYHNDIKIGKKCSCNESNISDSSSDCSCNESNISDSDSDSSSDSDSNDKESLPNCNKRNICEHNKSGIKLFTDRVTIKGHCSNYNTEIPIHCYTCNSEFKHREWRIRFYGCNKCFKEKVNTNYYIDYIGIWDIQLCINCSDSKLIYHDSNNINRKRGPCSFISILTKGALTKGANKR